MDGPAYSPTCMRNRLLRSYSSRTRSLDSALVKWNILGIIACWKASAPLPADVSAGGHLSSPHTHTETYTHTHYLQSFVHSCIVLCPTLCWAWGGTGSPGTAVGCHVSRMQAARARRCGCGADGHCPLAFGLETRKTRFVGIPEGLWWSHGDYFRLSVDCFGDSADCGASAAPPPRLRGA